MKVLVWLKLFAMLKFSARFIFYGLILTNLFWGCKTRSETIESNSQPNLVIIFADDMGYGDLSSYGQKRYQTPHLDQMAAEGMRFTNFYASQAVCSASRASLLTGCYANRVGIHGALFPNAKIGLNPEEVTLAELVKQKDYATAIFGKWHLGDHPDFLPTRQGFDHYYGIPYSNDMWPMHPDNDRHQFPRLPLIEQDSVVAYLDDQQNELTTQLTEKAVEFIRSNKNRPFFLYLAHPMPHVPLFVSDKFRDKSGAGLYGDVITEIDWSVGQVLQAISDEGLDENTLVIFTSDNGPWLSYGTHSGVADPLREGKGTSLEGGIRGPGIMRWPGKIPAGKEQTKPAATIDIFPTVAEVFGLELPDHKIDGRSIWPLLTDQPLDSAIHEAYFIYYKTNELQGILSGDGRWKLYFPHEYRSLEGRTGRDDGMPIEYNNRVKIGLELYDLENDVSEKNNVIDQNPEVAARLLALAEKMRDELGDQLTGQTGKGNREPGRIIL